VISALIELKGKFKRGGYKGIDLAFIENIPFPAESTEKQKGLLREISLKTRKLNSLVVKSPTMAASTMIIDLDKQINDHVLDVFELKGSKFLNLINEVND
jgi:DNA transposition AAA+ family ATPase